MKRLLVIVLLAIQTTFAAAHESRIELPTAEYIRCGGSFHIVEDGGALVLNRHSKELFDGDVIINAQKANTPSGIYIEFTTNSSQIECLLTPQSESCGTLRSPVVSIYRDGEMLGSQNIKNGLKLTTESGDMTHWKIYMPVMYSLRFEGLRVDKQAKFEKLKPIKNPVYVAIGDSISHGVGQTNLGSENTYPALLAKIKGWELYNLAVGGSSISPNIADDLRGKNIDIITILWGYNDWCFRSEPYDDIKRRYEELITRLRADHPSTKIYAILPTFSISKASRNRGDEATLDGIRSLQRSVVESLIKSGDESLYLIDGESITSKEDLNDNVHLNTDGARNFAEKLSKVIK